MTAFVPLPLTLVLDPSGPGALRVAVGGDLDFTTAGELLTTVVAALDGGGLTDVRLDCGGLRICDSSGLSALLTVHRQVTEAGARLHLDDRPAALDRLLDVSGTYEHLTGEPATSDRWHSTTPD
ncbi:Anti-sigma F factor antagonist [Nonomuraea coxensis DSM 45129]|uniref:Anti-sigma F factor antagonist n=1 Tax=Nonomuraea coxensis DSM 45129 TaxID=1122611 RepID=A0ABX8U866_9ACTN|nr:STAS domain-containing protein [Nonomuraea coxensis]QYC42883.1 Anti-sigma F factor antagonist [Nonomuraea coxensis DSM 45129]